MSPLKRHKKPPRIIKCCLMRQYWTLNLFGVLLNRKPDSVAQRTINHELIHTAQMRELLWLPFYVIYALEWLVRFLLTFNAGKAYRSVSFEREAYANDHNMQYLAHRRKYAQWRRKTS